MADTQRSKSELTTLYANNTSQDISPQDLRDFVETFDRSYASYYLSSASGNTNVTATPEKANGTTAEIASHRFTVATSNRATYTGTPAVQARIQANVSFSSTAGNLVGVLIAKNGTVIASSESPNQTGPTTTYGFVTCLASHVTCEENDYFEVFIKSRSGTINITVQFMTVEVETYLA